MKGDTETIVLGGGCFWCTEAAFQVMKGVVKTTVGYAGGASENPTYEQVCSGDTGHAEVMKLEYDPKLLTLEKVLDVFFAMHDPTSLNRQGADFGTQYRSIVLCTSEDQRSRVENFIRGHQEDYSKPIVTEVKMLGKFYQAEEYHQRYFEKNPNAGYCMFVVKPKVDKIKKKFGSSKSK